MAANLVPNEGHQLTWWVNNCLPGPAGRPKIFCPLTFYTHNPNRPLKCGHRSSVLDFHTRSEYVFNLHVASEVQISTAMCVRDRVLPVHSFCHKHALNLHAWVVTMRGECGFGWLASLTHCKSHLEVFVCGSTVFL